ncbi:MAG: EAL domain-containing protein [Aliarcobacter sp.]|nr:EAL domain-containing protein [Aliarcobacter sp.]
MKKALKNEEFILYYQPKINMSIGNIVGVEALIRWQHPEKGIVPPLNFLPIIEEDSFSINIGEWVIYTALSQIKSWQEQGINIPISVNVGAYQLLSEGFVNRLKSILSQFPTVKPDMLELEVLETSKLEDLDKAKNVMKACIKLGISFSLDDFGTGYSSLIYLKQLPIKQIKIDQNFVLGMLNNPNDLSILEGIIGLSKAFHLSVIAEGIETSEHAITLLGLGCELGQGYEIARPMPAELFFTWLKEYKPNLLWQNQDLLDANQRQILFIKVQHRDWIENIKAVLNKKESLHNQNINGCTFEKWLKNKGIEYLGDRYNETYFKYKNICTFTNKLLMLNDNGQNLEALAKFDELYNLCDELYNDLVIVNSI